MEDGGGDSSSIPRSDSNSKVVGEQSNCDEFQQKDGLSRKRVKMRHLDSVFRSDDMNGRLKTNEEDDDMSPLTDVKVASDFESEETTLPWDLNAEFCFHTNSDSNSANSRGIALDLNVEDVSSSINQSHSHPYKNTAVLKPRDVSHSQTQTSTALEKKDPLRVWKEMKQNGFLSSSHGGICVQNSVVSSSHGGIPVPKKRGRKSKNDHVLNKKMELAKREQVDRFTKIAAPTGLLNGLNPGIINHVRNRKQVHSIIQALVKSEKLEHFHSQSKHPSHLNTNHYTPRQLGYSDQCRHPNTFSSTLAKRTTGCTIPMLKPCSSNSEEKCGDGDSTMIDQVSEDGTLTLKLSSSAKAAGNTNASSLSNEESANLITASSLSVKAASVASQWLELLQQDIKGRLSALRRSKKRVRDVIATELPFLISKEFSDQENDPYITQNNSATADQHRARWSTLFDQMDKALSEEEKQLESWSYQVKEMQLHCDQGLNHIHGNMIYGLQQLGASIMESKLGKVDGSDKELAVRAAAASIYSTCNFLLTKENVSCF